MASIRSDVRTYLQTLSSVTDLTGARVYPMGAPNSATFPFVTVTRVSSNHYHHTTDATGLVRDRIQLNAFASTAISLNNVCEALRNAMDTYRGTMGTSTVRNCTLEDESDDSTPPTDGSDELVYSTRQDYFLWRTEAAPTA